MEEANVSNTKKNWLEITIGIILVLLGIGAALTAYFLDKSFKKAWFIYTLYIFGSIVILVGAGLLYRLYQDYKGVEKKINVREMTLIAFQSAITIILYYFAKFNVPFFPGFLDIQVSEVPALITSFIYGPGAGALVIFIRFLVKLPGTFTAGVGEFADLLLGLVVVVTSGLIYKKNRTLKGALIGTGVAMGLGTLVACLSNWVILIPAYINIAGMPMQALVNYMAYTGLNVTEANFMVIYIFVGVLPFNLFRYILVYAITFLLYKRTHFLFDKITNARLRKLS